MLKCTRRKLKVGEEIRAGDVFSDYTPIDPAVFDYSVVTEGMDIWRIIAPDENGNYNINN